MSSLYFGFVVLVYCLFEARAHLFTEPFLLNSGDAYTHHFKFGTKASNKQNTSSSKNTTIKSLC
jgi:hypothetical protein